MKKIRYLFISAPLFVLGAFYTNCHKSPNIPSGSTNQLQSCLNSKLLGTWHGTIGGIAETLTFSANCSFTDTICQATGTYPNIGADSGNALITITSNNGNAGCLPVGQNACTYSIVGNSLYYDCGSGIPPFDGQDEIVCPTNYVPVPRRLGYTTKPFCVAKFEMKNVGGVATSQASGLPWVNISRDQSISACAAIGAGYNLITNAQWQSVAQNIEGVGFNWSGGAVGNLGGMSTGHTDNAPATYLDASSDDNDSCYGTGQACDLSTWSNQRRVFKLSNGSYIWDFGGNVWEWVADNSSTNFGADTFISILTAANHPATGVVGGVMDFAKHHFGSAGDYTSLSSGIYGGIGYAWMNGFTAGAINRGGSWDRLVNAGIFSVDLSFGPGYTAGPFGFRCVWSP